MAHLPLPARLRHPFKTHSTVQRDFAPYGLQFVCRSSVAIMSRESVGWQRNSCVPCECRAFVPGRAVYDHDDRQVQALYDRLCYLDETLDVTIE